MRSARAGHAPASSPASAARRASASHAWHAARRGQGGRAHLQLAQLEGLRVDGRSLLLDRVLERAPPVQGARRAASARL